MYCTTTKNALALSLDWLNLGCFFGVVISEKIGKAAYSQIVGASDAMPSMSQSRFEVVTLDSLGLRRMHQGYHTDEHIPRSHISDTPYPLPDSAFVCLICPRVPQNILFGKKHSVARKSFKTLRWAIEFRKRLNKKEIGAFGLVF